MKVGNNLNYFDFLVLGLFSDLNRVYIKWVSNLFKWVSNYNLFLY